MPFSIVLEVEAFNTIMRALGDLVDKGHVKPVLRYIALSCTKENVTASVCDGASFTTLTVPALDMRANDDLNTPRDTFLPVMKPFDKNVGLVTIEDDGKGKVRIIAGNNVTTIDRPLEPMYRAEQAFPKDEPAFVVRFNPERLVSVLKPIIKTRPKKRKWEIAKLSFYKFARMSEYYYDVVIEPNEPDGRFPATSLKTILKGVAAASKDKSKK